MLYREFQPTLIYAQFSQKKYCDFEHWKEAASTGTQALASWVAAHPIKTKGESLPVDGDLYRALKDCLVEYFQGKCAYCESEFETVAWGDVEHYRPKRGVTGETHPGYYWLAYSERNLMPSCQRCNQGQGKRNYFPIAGERALNPQHDLAAELPLLLNPYEKEDCAGFEQHFRFVIEESGWDLFPTGRIEGVTDRGKTSVKVYDLDRGALRRRRQKNQTNALRALKLAVGTAALKQEWDSLFNPEQEHAAAVRAVCLRWRDSYMRRLKESTGSD